MTVLYLILLIASCTCFVAEALGVKARVSLIPLGLALWVLVAVIQVAQVV